MAERLIHLHNIHDGCSYDPDEEQEGLVRALGCARELAPLPWDVEHRGEGEEDGHVDQVLVIRDPGGRRYDHHGHGIAQQEAQHMGGVAGGCGGGALGKELGDIHGKRKQRHGKHGEIVVDF